MGDTAGIIIMFVTLILGLGFSLKDDGPYIKGVLRALMGMFMLSVLISALLAIGMLFAFIVEGPSVFEEDGPGLARVQRVYVIEK